MKTDNENITVLSLIEHIRKRPAMYVGDMKEGGLFCLIKEFLLEILFLKEVKRIHIKIYTDSSFEINFSKFNYLANSKAVISFFTTYSYDYDNLSFIRINALSQELTISLKENNKTKVIKFAKGTIKSNRIVKIPLLENEILIRFKLDQSIFNPQLFNEELLRNYLYRISFFFPKKSIVFDTQISKMIFHYNSNDGLIEYFYNLILPENPIIKPIHILGKTEGMNVEIIFTYTYSTTNNIYSYVNKSLSPEHGAHVNGFLTGLKKILKNYFPQNNINKIQYKHGLYALISINLKQPAWAGAIKWKLTNREAALFVRKTTEESLDSFFEENPNIFKKIKSKVLGEDYINFYN